MLLPIPQFKVLLYGPGLPPAGLRARAHFEESVLVVQGRGHWFTIQGDRLILDAGGFDGRRWLLSWSTPSGLVTAMLQSDDALAVFIKLAPPRIAMELKRVYRTHGEKHRTMHFGMALLAVFVFVSVFALGMFLIYEDEVSAWSANRATMVGNNKSVPGMACRIAIRADSPNSVC